MCEMTGKQNLVLKLLLNCISLVALAQGVSIRGTLTRGFPTTSSFHERHSMTATGPRLAYLMDLWDDKSASQLDEPELLRYRSNLLGADLRITNFGGGNTSSKVDTARPAGRDGEEGSVGEGKRRRSGEHQAQRICDAVSR